MKEIGDHVECPCCHQLTAEVVGHSAFGELIHCPFCMSPPSDEEDLTEHPVRFD